VTHASGWWTSCPGGVDLPFATISSTTVINVQPLTGPRATLATNKVWRNRNIAVEETERNCLIADFEIRARALWRGAYRDLYSYLASTTALAKKIRVLVDAEKRRAKRRLPAVSARPLQCPQRHLDPCTPDAVADQSFTHGCAPCVGFAYGWMMEPGLRLRRPRRSPGRGGSITRYHPRRLKCCPGNRNNVWQFTEGNAHSCIGRLFMQIVLVQLESEP